jgi:predicted nucleic acid-binding protein
VVTTRGLIDTNIVIRLGAVDAALLPDELVISTVTLAELSAGPHHSPDPVERARRMSVLQLAEATFDPLPFDGEAARAYGRVFATVAAAGRVARGARAVDLLIAATALAVGLPLYTRNAEDFRALERLIDVVPV